MKDSRTSKNKARLMSHMVAWYPDERASMDVARALVDGGSAFLEVQFPFSDPSADGAAIQEACNRALSEGFTTSGGFKLVQKIARYSGDVPLFIMSYASIVFARGIERFIIEAKKSGAKGLIIPDLMPGYDEGLYNAGIQNEMAIIPVIAPDISEQRLSQILAFHPAYLYASLRIGITGKRTDVTKDVFSFLGRLSSAGVKVLAGFGIDSHSQVEKLHGHAYGLIVGSAIVRTISAAADAGMPVYQAVKDKICQLRGG